VISDADLVDTIAALYAPDGRFQHVATTAGIDWGISRNYGAMLLVFRGSVTPEDWLRDLESEASRIVPGYPSLGHVPYGFGAGLVPAYEAIKTELDVSDNGGHLYILGHSLGAAHAAEIAGMFVLDGVAVERLVLCGCPNPGMVQLETLLCRMPCENYVNGKDPVPDLPVPIKPLLEWRAAAPLGLIYAEPDNPADPMAWHHISAYQKAVRKLCST
jgi:Lipase (class 3)